MARLYSNENFPLPVVERLRALGHDVLTTQEAGKADQAVPDDEVLRFASGENRAVLTINRRHFIRLHGESAQHAGIIACTLDPDFAGQAARIHEAIGGQGGLNGQLIRVNRPPK
jgi:predicted nuclease of predicted toxin-antitoxin system